MSLKKLANAAVFTAVTVLLSTLLRIPIAHGYLNLGDLVVIAGAGVMNPGFAMASAAIGSGLSDLIVGYPVYIPATVLIKLLMALAVYLINRLFRSKRSFFSYLVCAATAEVIMVAGYFVFEVFLYGTGGALFSLYGNLIQAAAAMILSPFLCLLLDSAIKADRHRQSKTK